MSGIILTSLPSMLALTRGNAWLESSLRTPPSAARAFAAGDRLTAAVELSVPEKCEQDVVAVAELEGPGGARFSITGKRAGSEV